MLILIIKTIHLVTLVCFIKWQLLRFLIKVKLNWLILATAHLNKSESFFFKCNRFFQSSSVCFQLGIWKDASQTKGERLSTADFGNEKAKDRVTRCWVWSIFFWKCTTGKTNGSKRLLSVSGCISKWNGRQNVVASNSWWYKTQTQNTNTKHKHKTQTQNNRNKLGGRKATPKVHHSTNTKHKIQNTKYNTQTQTQYNTEMKKATDVVDISALFFPRWY